MGGFPCIFRMAVSIETNGVNPSGYDDFVEYIVRNTSPSNSRIGVTYSSAVIDTTVFIVLLIIVIIFITFAIMIILLLSKGFIGAPSAICLIIVGAALMVLYFAVCRSFTQSISYEVMPVFQETLVDTALYALNSALRDTIYLATCE